MTAADGALAGAGAWRLVVGTVGEVPVLDGPANMAVDHALLESVKAGGPPALRLYRWDPPTLSFGRNQPARDLYDREAARERGVGFVRRPTGGQAVLHDDELTYAVVAPVQLVGRPRQAYRRINAALVAGLRELGVAAALAEGSRTDGIGPDWGGACFRTPAAGEVVVGGRKLVGSAQRTEGRVVLQHGSILLGGSQEGAEALLVEPPASASNTRRSAPGWTTVASELGKRPPTERVESAVVAGFEASLGTTLARDTLTPEESGDARRLRELYRSEGWTWRR